MPKRSTRSRKSAASQPDETTPTERLENIGQFFDALTARFNADEQTEEIRLLALSYWSGWPFDLSIVRTWGKSAGDTESAYGVRQKLADLHEAVSRWLMRKMTRRNLDNASSALWEESRFCRERT